MNAIVPSAVALKKKYSPERIAKLHAGRDAHAAEARALREAAEARGVMKCAKCLVEKALDDFPAGRKTRSGKPRYAYCKPCHREYQRVVVIKRNYDLTPEEYAKIEALQGGVCAICLNPPKRCRLAVDHDHKSGLVRGLLCSWCNRALGQFRDDIEKVRRVVQFFIDPPATRALGAAKFGIKGRVGNKSATRRRLNPEKYGVKRRKPKSEPFPEEQIKRGA